MLYIMHFLRLPVFVLAGWVGCFAYMYLLHKILDHKAATLKERN